MAWYRIAAFRRGDVWKANNTKRLGTISPSFLWRGMWTQIDAASL